MKYNSTSLSNVRTRLSNQRTYLAYMRTGLAISGVAAATQNYVIMSYGILMLIISTVQYILIEQSLENKELELMNHYIPILYTLSLIHICRCRRAI